MQKSFPMNGVGETWNCQDIDIYRSNTCAFHFIPHLMNQHKTLSKHTICNCKRICKVYFPQIQCPVQINGIWKKLTQCERLCSLVCWVRIKQLLWVSNWQTNVYPLSHFILSVSLSVNSMNEQMKEFSNFGELFLLYNILVNKNSHLLFWLVMNVNANKNTSNSFYLKFLRKNVGIYVFVARTQS